MGPPSDRRAGLIVADSLSAFIAVFAGVVVRFGTGFVPRWELALGLPSVGWLAGWFSLLTVVTFGVAGVYREDVYWNLRTEAKDVLRGVFLLAPTVLSLLYLFKLEDVSRIALAVTFATLGGLAIAVRSLLRERTRRSLVAGRMRARWLVVGGGEGVARIEEIVSRHPHVGAELVGHVGEMAGVEGVPWLGGIEALPEILRSEVIDEVIVASASREAKDLEAIVSVAVEQGKTVRMPLEELAPHALRGRVEGFDGIPMWSIVTTSERRLQLALKRIMDAGGSAVLLAIASPVLILCALAILIREGWPVFYGQERAGLHGRPFTMWKLRTMIPGAHDVREGFAHLNERSGPVFKIENDPRVTGTGRVLRRWSLDELPQLWNVLTGEMSLVGPRPQPTEEVEEYDLWHRRRLSMRPGITGLWQIRARQDPSFDTWMQHDLDYIDRWSLWVDLRVLANTPRTVIRGSGQ